MDGWKKRDRNQKVVLIVYFLGSEKLKDSEDEGMSHFLVLIDVTENLLKGIYNTD